MESDQKFKELSRFQRISMLMMVTSINMITEIMLGYSESRFNEYCDDVYGHWPLAMASNQLSEEYIYNTIDWNETILTILIISRNAMGQKSWHFHASQNFYAIGQNGRNCMIQTG